MNPFRQFFDGHDVVRFKPGLEGQRVLDDGTILIGDRAGPQRHASNLAHEMAHLVEIDDDRMRMWGWGLKLPEVVVFGQTCVEPRTMQITAREIRVFAFQANLHRAFGLPFSYTYCARLCEWLPDTIWVPLDDGTMPYAADATQVRASQTRWVEKEIRKLSRRKAYGFDAFRTEWWRKIDFLKSRESCRPRATPPSLPTPRPYS